MRNLLAARGNDLPPLHCKLHAVWYVDADSSYRVRKSRFVSADYTAVRTVSGRGILHRTGNRTSCLAAESLGIFPSRDIASYHACEEGWKFYWFEFDMTSRAASLPVSVTAIPLSIREQEDMSQCFAALGSRIPEECLSAEALFQYLLSQWISKTAHPDNPRISTPEVVRILEKGFHSRMSVGELARQAGMCERSFRDAVRRSTGASPKEYIQKMEMDAALELLRTTNMTVSEVSEILFYGNPFYFSRAFKKYFGFSPSQASALLSAEDKEK